MLDSAGALEWSGAAGGGDRALAPRFARFERLSDFATQPRQDLTKSRGREAAKPRL